MSASAEEKLLGPAKANQYLNRNRSESSYPRPDRNTIKCFKCGKNRRNCRNSKNALPKPEKPQVNIVNKFCSNCKKTGHSRDECWSKKGRRGNKVKPPEHKKKPRKKSESDRKKQRHQRRESESTDSNSESEPYQMKQRQPQPVIELHILKK